MPRVRVIILFAPDIRPDHEETRSTHGPKGHQIPYVYHCKIFQSVDLDGQGVGVQHPYIGLFSEAITAAASPGVKIKNPKWVTKLVLGPLPAPYIVPVHCWSCGGVRLFCAIFCVCYSYTCQ